MGPRSTCARRLTENMNWLGAGQAIARGERHDRYLFEEAVVGAYLRSLLAQVIKYFMLDRSSWPPSCWRQASSPSSNPVFTGGILAVRKSSFSPMSLAPSSRNTGPAATVAM